MTEVALSTDVAGLSTAVTGLCEGFEGPSVVDVHRSAREGACIAAGVTAVGACVWRNENGVCGGVECVMAGGAE
jgi:hypothetical protein